MLSRGAFLLLLPLVASLTLATPAGAGFFVPTGGPDGRNACDIAAAPNGNLYATTTSSPTRVYALPAGADRWSVLPNPGSVVANIEVGPDGRIWLFGYGSLFVSTDGGFNWTAPGTVPAIANLTFDNAGRALAGTQVGLYRSGDGGATWTLLALPAQPVDAVEVGSTHLWAAVGTQVYRSDDQGETWAPVATLPSRATALAEHPAGGLYAGLSNVASTCLAGGMFRVTAEGSVSRLGLDAYGVRDILVRGDGSVLVSALGPCDFYTACGGCGSPGLPDCGTSGVYRSPDAGGSWGLVSPEQGTPFQIVTRRDGVLFTVSQSGGCASCWTVAPGVLASTDGGATWAPRNTGLGTTGVSWVATPFSSNVIFAANQNSVYGSSDHGATWLLFGDMSPLLCAQYYGSIAFAAVGPAVYTFEANPSVIHRVLPGSLTEVTPLPAGNWIFKDMIATGTGALVMAASGGLAGSIYVDPTPMTSGFVQMFGYGPQGISRLEAGPGSRIAGTTSTSTYLSGDAGLSWSAIANVGNGPLAFSRDGSTLYVVQVLLNTVQIWRLRESAGWTPESVALPAGTTRIMDLIVDPTGALYVLAEFNNLVPAHVLRLSSGATRWDELDVLSDASQISLASDGYLYVATPSGVWRSASAVGISTDVAAETLDRGVVVSPNPLSQMTTFRFEMARPGAVHLTVYDVAGRLVSTLLGGKELPSGSRDVTWRPSPRTPNGVYVYRLSTPTREFSGRILLLR